MATIDPGAFETRMVYAQGVDGREYRGPATEITVESAPDLAARSWSRTIGTRLGPSPRITVTFVEHGEVPVSRYSFDLESWSTYLSRRAEEARRERARRRIERDRVDVTDLVGRRALWVQMDSGLLAFHLTGGDVWAFRPLDGHLWDLDVTRPYILANGGAVSQVKMNGALVIHTDRRGQRTIPCVIRQRPAPSDPWGDSWAGVSKAEEPSRDWEHLAPVIAGARNIP